MVNNPVWAVIQGCEGRTSTVSADKHTLLPRVQAANARGQREAMAHAPKVANEGIHEAVEIVEKLLWRKLGRRQELSRESRRCAKHQFGGRNAGLLQRHTPEVEEDPRQL